MARSRQREGKNQKETKGYYLMKTITKHRKRGLLLSLLCAGVVATFFGGCAEGPYVTAYDNGYYYPTAYYTPDYYDYYGYPSYSYGPTYNRTIVRYGPGYSSYYDY
jgi:hypothetical protein